MGAEVVNDDPDAAAAAMAARQHGIVTLRQLDQVGIRRRGRQLRLRRGRLHRIHRGVFALGHDGLSREGHWMAAVLAAGPAAVLSHVSAGELWGVLGSRKRQNSRRITHPIHVSVNGRSESRRRIVVHHSRTLTPQQATRQLGIPVTTPSRTLGDLRRILPQPLFAAALRQAEFLQLPIGSALDPDHTRSELEARFLELCRRHRLPKPEVNVPVGPFTVDFLWPGRRLVAEVDGFQAHGSRSAFETDRARDVELRLLGYQVIRLTWRQLTDRPRETIAALRRLLI